MYEHAFSHGAETATSTELDRRTSERYQCSRQRFVRLLARPNLRYDEASIQDFSMKSIGLVLDKPYEPGTILALQLRSATAGLSGVLAAQVRHATARADGRWLLGCTLSKRLTNDEALALL